jgi:hypothetical protein
MAIRRSAEDQYPQNTQEVSCKPLTCGDNSTPWDPQTLKILR